MKTRSALRRARKLGKGSSGSQLHRHQARLLGHNWPVKKHRFDAFLPIPRVVVFSGHMIDQAGRPNFDFPPNWKVLVSDAIAKRVSQLDAGSG